MSIPRLGFGRIYVKDVANYTAPILPPEFADKDRSILDIELTGEPDLALSPRVRKWHKRKPLGSSFLLRLEGEHFTGRSKSESKWRRLPPAALIPLALGLLQKSPDPQQEAVMIVDRASVYMYSRARSHIAHALKRFLSPQFIAKAPAEKQEMLNNLRTALETMP